MPELPEVETVCRKLKKYKGETVSRVQLLRPDLRYPLPNTLRRQLKGMSLEGVRRRAKYLIFDFGEFYLISHLGMTGNWRKGSGALKKHDHVVIHTDRSKLIYSDPRRFGYIDLCHRDELKSHRYFINLGVEPLSRKFSTESLKASATGRKTPIKSLIMNQEIVVGVGNIYANEALFRSGIRPGLAAEKVSSARVKLLVENIKLVLADAIKKGGSSISDFEDPDGQAGYFQMSFQVYGRDGLDCPVCGGKIKKTMIGQRSSFYCLKCQK